MATLLDTLLAITNVSAAINTQLNALNGSVIVANQQAGDMYRAFKLSEQNAGTAAVNMRDFIINQLRFQYPTLPQWIFQNLSQYHLSQDTNGDFIRDDKGNYSISTTVGS